MGLGVLHRSNEFNSKARYVIALSVSVAPLNLLRVLLYKALYRYEISWSARIGFGTIIAVDEARIGDARIGMLNTFHGPFKLQVGDGVAIGPRNTFRCGTWVLERQYQEAGYLRTCKIGSNAMIGAWHFVDATGGFEIGANTAIGGRHSQFWTHGAGVVDRSVVIGSDCFIGSGAIFTPGSRIGDNCAVNVGSVVTRKFEADNLLIGGGLARVIQSSYDWRNHGPLVEPEERGD